MNKTVIVVGLVLIVGAGLFFITRSSSTPQIPTSQIETPKTSSTSAQETSKILAGKTSILYDFSKAKYGEAIASDKLVVLYFYADWCPICKEEIPKMYEVFNELTSDQVIGLRVNYNDSYTDTDEQNLAREYGVAYQHTKVFVKNGQRVLKSPESWDRQRYLDEISKAL